jgi:hypothetical protein
MPEQMIITVVRLGDKCFAMKTWAHQNRSDPTMGEIIFKRRQRKNETVEALHDRARQKAREENIAFVQDLDRR